MVEFHRVFIRQTPNKSCCAMLDGSIAMPEQPCSKRLSWAHETGGTASPSGVRPLFVSDVASVASTPAPTGLRLWHQHGPGELGPAIEFDSHSMELGAIPQHVFVARLKTGSASQCRRKGSQTTDSIPLPRMARTAAHTLPADGEHPASVKKNRFPFPLNV